MRREREDEPDNNDEGDGSGEPKSAEELTEDLLNESESENKLAPHSREQPPGASDKFNLRPSPDGSDLLTLAAMDMIREGAGKFLALKKQIISAVGSLSRDETIKLIDRAIDEIKNLQAASRRVAQTTISNPPLSRTERGQISQRFDYEMQKLIRLKMRLLAAGIDTGESENGTKQ